MNWTSIIGKEYAERCHVSSLKKINQKTYSLFTAVMQVYLNFLIQLLKLKKNKRVFFKKCCGYNKV